MDENQNNVSQIRWETWNPSLRDKVNQFNSFVASVKQQKKEQKVQETSQLNQALFTSWMNTQNHWVAKECNRAIRMSQVADGIKEFLPTQPDFSDIDFSDDYRTDGNVINSFKAAFPEYSNIMESYVKDDSNTNCDPTDFYYQTWWMKTKKEEEKSWWDRYLENLTYWVESWWRWIKGLMATLIDFIEWWEDMSKWYAQDLFSKNYFNKNWNDLNDEEREFVINALRTKEIYDEYKPTVQRWLLDTVEGGVDVWISISSPLAFLIRNGIAAASATPYLRELLSALWNWFWEVWRTFVTRPSVLTYFNPASVPLILFRESLQTDEEKKRFDQDVWMLWLWSIFWLRKTWWGWKTASRWDLITPEFYQKAWESLKTTPERWNKISERWNKRSESENAQLTQQLEEQAWKATDAITPKDRQRVAEWLYELDANKVKTFKDGITESSKVWESIKRLEDDIYSQDSRLFKPDDTWEIKTYELEWKDMVYKTVKWVDYVQPMINVLKKLYKWNADELARIELIERKFNSEWLSRWEINELARNVSAEIETYKSTKRHAWEPYDTDLAKEAEDARQKWKEFARWDNPDLIDLDRRWSNIIRVAELFDDLEVKLNQYKNNIPNKWVIKNLWWWAWKLFTKTWLRDLIYKALGIWAEEKYNPLTRQNQLQSILRNIDKLNKKLWNKKVWEKYIESAVEEFNVEMERDLWPIEWEVISNETNWREYKAPNNRLEEIVQSETVYPESKMLNNNYPNGEPVDFTSMPWIDPKWNVFKWFKEVQEINNIENGKSNPK